MSVAKPRNRLPHDGAVPGLLLFRRRRVVRGLVRGCHSVDWHDVDEAVDFVNDTLVSCFLRPVEATHCLLVCAALNEDCVCRREAKLDFLARLGVGVDVRVVVHDHLPFFHELVSCGASSISIWVSRLSTRTGTICRKAIRSCLPWCRRASHCRRSTARSCCQLRGARTTRTRRQLRRACRRVAPGVPMVSR